MTITEILDNQETPVAEKLKQLSKVVSKAREAYGNTATEVNAPKVNSTEGYVELKFLSPEDKLAIAKGNIRGITMETIALTELSQGAVFDKEFERLLALDPVLANISTVVTSKYL